MPTVSPEAEHTISQHQIQNTTLPPTRPLKARSGVHTAGPASKTPAGAQPAAHGQLCYEDW